MSSCKHLLYLEENNIDIKTLGQAMAYYHQDSQKCYELCMELGEDSEISCLLLGFMYFNNKYVERDIIKSMRYLIKSGFPRAKAVLPKAFRICHKQGIKLPLDLEQYMFDNIQNRYYHFNDHKFEWDKLEEVCDCDKCKKRQSNQANKPIKEKGLSEGVPIR